jgi:hypothetical protein
MTLEQLTLPFIWLLNGFLAVVYLTLENIVTVALIPGLVWLVMLIPVVQRAWILAAAILSIVAGLSAPSVVGIWLLLMVYGSILAIKLEKFNVESLSWRIISGIAAYVLIGLGFSIYQGLAPSLSDPYGTFAQAKGYLDVIITIAVFLGPLGFVGLLVQSLFAHPPLEGRPEDIVYNVRTRGQQS